MKCSIIIPFYHSKDILEMNLKALLALPRTDYEIIIVDDFSNLNISAFQSLYQCQIIRNSENKGPSFSRNVGAQKSNGEVLCFLDSDIVIDADKIRNNLKFIEDFEGKMAITGGVSLNSPYQNFLSRYKNYYLCYSFAFQLERVTFLYGSFVMIKKKFFIKWPEDIRYGEDTYLGNSLYQDGVVLHFDHQLQVTHYKKFNLFSILKNDFLVPFYFCRTYVENIYRFKFPTVLSFSHVQGSQIISIGVLGILFSVSMYSVIFHSSRFIFFLCFLQWYWLTRNRHFFKLLRAEEGNIFFFKSIFFTMIDQFVMGLGVFFGLIFHSLYLLPFFRFKSNNVT